MHSNDDDRLALFGGRPVRSEGPIERVVNRLEIQAALERAYHDGDWHKYHGKNTERLHESLADFHGVSHVELCCSGTAALEIALKGVNVKPGDEVLVSGYDFRGIVASVLAVGAMPVVVDIDLTTLAPTVANYSKAVTERTKALVVSHLHGNAAPVDSIMEWAKPPGIAVVEDACQAPGAMIAGKRAGAWGDVGVLSFGGSKLLTAGRGGAVLTSDPRIAQRIKLHCERGNHAFPLSELQAAVLLPQLETLDDDNRLRFQAVKWLVERLDSRFGVTPTVAARSDVSPAFYKLGLLLTGDHWNAHARETVAAAFRAEGVAIDEGFAAVPSLFAKARFRAADDLSASMIAGERMLVLHHPVLLAGEDELELIVNAVQKVSNAFQHLP
jgi:perosamine synthetase